MKRLLALLLALLILLCSCQNADGNTDTDIGDGDDINDGSTPPSSDADEKKKDEAYKDIECRVPKMYSSKAFTYTGSMHAFTLTFPSDWSFESPKDDVISIMRDGQQIGSMERRNVVSNGDWKSVYNYSKTYSSRSVAYDIMRNTAAEEPQFRYRFVFTYNTDRDPEVIILTVSYGEVCAKLCEKLCKDFAVQRIASDPKMGFLSDIDTSRTVAFIGNSFIGSSQVASIFKQMLQQNGKNLSVKTFSYGGAQIYNFARNDSLLSELRSGRYGVVFLCGFYGKYNNADLQIILDACEQGNAKVVAFPAHNETPSSIESAKAYKKDLTFLDWKAEIDMLIDDGVEPLDMFWDDGNKHSKPLAGFVGAHMIYRAIYDEIPKGTITGDITTSYINSKLGDYPKLGFVYTVELRNAIYFN